MKTLLLAVLLLTLNACDSVPGIGGDNGEEETTDEQITGTDSIPEGFGQLNVDSAISKVPKIVDPVLPPSGSDTATNEFDKSTGSLEVETFTAYAAGIKLGTQTKLSDFDGKSYAACEMVNRARGFLYVAATADKVDCELAFLLGSNKTFYDGKFHVIEIKEADEGEIFTQRIRFKFEGSEDKISAMTVQYCEDGEQSIYLHKTIAADGDIDITSKRFSRPGNPQVDEVKMKVSVVGKVDENQNYIGLKKILSVYANKFSNGETSYVKERITQSSKNIFYTGHLAQHNTEADRVVSFLNLVDLNTASQPFSVKNYLLGDGAMAMSLKGEATIVQGWNGSSKAVNNSVAMIAKVTALKENLPGQPSSQETLSFEGDEVYDCTGDVDLTLNDADLMKLIEAAKLTDEGGEGGGEDELCMGYWLPQDTHLECDSNTDKTGA
jgi:hypothetical protein